MKKILSIALMGLVLMCVSCKTSDDFKPVVRFAVTSDVHILADDEPAGGQVTESTHEWRVSNLEQFGRLFTTANAYAKNSGTSYNKLDAVLVAGDYTDDGTVKQYKAMMDVLNASKPKNTQVLFSVGNHEFYDTGESGSSNQSTAKTYARFTEMTGQEPDTVTVINGFTFIGVSLDANGGRCLSKSKCEWLREQLEKAARKDSLKPVFVFTHFPPSNTVYGSPTSSVSGSYNDTYLDAVLKDFPQAVVFTGHYHKPADDPTNISQKDCTVIGSCNMSYGEGSVIYKDGSDEIVVITDDKGAYETTANGSYYSTYSDNTIMGTYIIIEADKDNRVRVQYYDLKTDSLVGEPIIIDSIGKKADFTFTTARKASSEMPAFAKGSSIKLVSSTCSTLQLEFPMAQCKDHVRNYRCEILKDGKVVQTIYRMDISYYFRDNDGLLLAPFSGLEPDTDYTVRIYAVNTYGVWGTEYLEGSFRTSSVPVRDGICRPDVFEALFDTKDSSVSNALTGEKLQKTGSAAVAVDSKIGKPAAVFNGSTSYSWYGISNWYELLRMSLTYEVQFRIASKPGSTVVVSGDMQHGGCGFEVHNDGKLYFCSYMKSDGWIKLATPCPIGEYVHAVATYDGSEVRLYVNGELADKAKCNSGICPPRMPTSLYMAIGADAELENKTGYRMTGTVTKVNIYSYALDENQVKDLEK